MGFLEGIFLWLAEQILKYLLNEALAQAQKLKNQIEEDRKRGKIDEANEKAYENASDRIARRKAALDLINRTPH